MTEREELDAAKAAEQEMETDADAMEGGIERLGEHIEEAERAARERPEVSEDGGTEGDEGEDA